jgi:hypothetical protein
MEYHSRYLLLRQRPLSVKFQMNSYRVVLCHRRDSSVGIATGYGPGSIPCRGKFFSSPPRPDWLWGRSNLLPNGYGGSFRGGKADEA